MRRLVVGADLQVDDRRRRRTPAVRSSIRRPMPCALIRRVHADGVHLVLERRCAAQPRDAGVTDQRAVGARGHVVVVRGCQLAVETPPPATDRRRRTAAPPTRRTGRRRSGVSGADGRPARCRRSSALRATVWRRAGADTAAPAAPARSTSRPPRRPGRPASGRSARSAAGRTAPRARVSRPPPAPSPGSTSAGALTAGTIGADPVAVSRPVDLAPAGIGDHQHVAGGLHADRVQAADAAHRDAQRVPVGGSGGHADPQAGERTGTAAHHDGGEIGHASSRHRPARPTHWASAARHAHGRRR